MIKIGDFARIAGVSVPALRHYDEEGLLSPGFVHPDSGYRYYRADQLRDVHRILVFKGLGLSLPEVRAMLHGDPDPVEMRRLLGVKREEAEARLAGELAQIRRIEHRISILEKEQTMPQLEVVRKTAPAMTVAAIRLEIPTNDQVGDLLGQAYGRLCESLAADRIAMRGPALGLWHSTPDMLTNETVDAAFEVDAESVSNPEVAVTKIPATDVATVVHIGPFSEFQQCHVALSEWMATNGFHLAGPYREIYHSHGEESATTEVQYPIAPD